MNGDDSITPPRELPPREVTVQLFDPSSRQPVKTWTFDDKPTITIGRGDTADVLISDAYVSRVHAELTYRDNQWILISRGRNGVLVGSQVITETPILGEVSFRLGSAGPILKFSCISAPAEATSATLSYTADTNPLLHLDETKLRDEVAQIASDDYFVRLQQKVKELRRNRDTKVPQ
jgi:pSer/pThr/pTyr-binding forkhead associated (FHA) protein